MKATATLPGAEPDGDLLVGGKGDDTRPAATGWTPPAAPMPARGRPWTWRHNRKPALQLGRGLDGHAGELAIVADPAHGQTLIEGGIDGDGVADLLIRLQGPHLQFPGLVL